jgi:hypothetical protein
MTDGRRAGAPRARERSATLHWPVVVLVIIAVGLTAPVLAAVFAFRRPSLVYILVLYGAGFLWLDPPRVARSTDHNPDGTVNRVDIEWIGHGWGAGAPPDSDSRTTSYAVYWPQLAGEVALLIAALTGLYFLLRYLLARERADSGAP